jgi:hypothetical protein
LSDPCRARDANSYANVAARARYSGWGLCAECSPCYDYYACSPDRGRGIVRKIERRFGHTFAPWGIALPLEDVKAGRRGKIVASGWAIWYLFGSDERGGYLDYYASHRMTGDRHVRVREDGPAEHLPTIRTFRVVSRDPEEDARLKAEYLEHNRRVGRMLEEKGFGVAGDEPLSVQVNRHLRLRGGRRHALPS